MAGVIENPILNSPFRESARHFAFDENGITDAVVEERRPSSYFVPVPAARKRGGQQAFDTEWTKDRVEENATINRIRDRVNLWRRGGHQHVTPTTRRLLEHWTDPNRERPLFFCQIEALETAIYLAEAVTKVGDQWIENMLRDEATRANPGLFRIAHKMATGTGKTVVMAMLIAWHTLNKAANAQDGRFTDEFLVVTPGITIRDRLRVLLPNDPGNYYRERDLVPPDLVESLGRARIVITNFHTFLLRESKIGKAAKLTKNVLGSSAFIETEAQMAKRVCRDLSGNKQIVVLNDEAHHCYRRKIDNADAESPKLTGDERKDAERREKDAKVWVSGLTAVAEKFGIKSVYDLSATPFFLQGSGYSEGALFPWVVSDFSLIDAIECGVVKIPRVPVSDDAMVGTGVTYRDLWPRIREALPRKGRKGAGVDAGGEPKLPPELQGALHSLYGNYEKAYRRWEQSDAAKHGGATPPVFIVVCNNTAVSKVVFDYVAGWDKTLPTGDSIPVPGELGIFSNVVDGAWSSRPATILVDSEQLESGDAMSDECKRIAATEINEFKREYVERFPGRDADELTDEDLLREVMNTVGKPGRLGEHVKCVVSVSMLTEGWDANTVTHILGVRAFGTQLLCEQVIGRGLRRRSYVPDENGMLAPDYAEVYGVPFSFIPAAGASVDPEPSPTPTRVRAVESRIACEITFPRVAGYRYELAGDTVTARFTEESSLALSAADVPTMTEASGIIGETVIDTLDDLRAHREQEVAFRVTRRLAERYFRDEDGYEAPWLFPELLRITKRWMNECLVLKDNTFPQLLLLHQYADAGVERLYRAIVRGRDDSVKRLVPILRPYEPNGSTRYVDFDTTRPVYLTDERKCHISHVVCDTESWEQKMAQVLEQMTEVQYYVKNHNLGFTIPYAIDGEQRAYIPDFIVRVDTRAVDGIEEPLNLIVEVSGAQRRDKVEKVATATEFWVPAVNAHGGFGRWDFIEISDPWDAQQTIRGHLDRRVTAAQQMEEAV